MDGAASPKISSLPIGVAESATSEEIAEAAAQVAKREALPLSPMHKFGLRRPFRLYYTITLLYYNSPVSFGGKAGHASQGELHPTRLITAQIRRWRRFCGMPCPERHAANPPGG